MKKISVIIVCFLGFASCVTKSEKTTETAEQIPVCKEETIVAVYDDRGAYQVPGCMDYAVPQIYGYADSSAEVEAMKRQMMVTVIDTTPKREITQEAAVETVETDKTEKETEEGEEIDVDKLEGEFPKIPNNKYVRNQVVMQNLQTRILAYCRGSDEEINECVERLECGGYRKITEIPYLAAKYDYLKKGTYPTRRWRSGENVPRW